MRLLLALAALALVVPAALAGDYRNPTAGRDVVLQIPGMHLAKVQRNLTYKPYLQLDVYRPRAAKGRLPAVLFFHGRTSADSPKDWGQYVGWGQLAAASGLAGVTVNHMDDPADVAAAVRYVRRNGAKLGIDGTRLCVAGFSAGAGTAMLAALNGSVPSLRCAVSYYGPLAARYQQTSPLAHLRADSVPTLVTKAGRDNAALNRSIDAFVAKARRLRVPVDLLVHPTGLHGFDVNGPGTRTEAIMRRTLAFLRAHLRAEQ